MMDKLGASEHQLDFPWSTLGAARTATLDLARPQQYEALFHTIIERIRPRRSDDAAAADHNLDYSAMSAYRIGHQPRKLRPSQEVLCERGQGAGEGRVGQVMASGLRDPMKAVAGDIVLVTGWRDHIGVTLADPLQPEALRCSR